MDWQTWIFAVGYFLLFALGALLMQLMWRRKQRTEIPFGKNVVLSRQPGEGQLELVRKLDENEILWIALGAGASALVLALLLPATDWFPGYWKLAWAGFSIVFFGVVFWRAMRWVATKLDERSNRYLGYFGERFVADCLEPLKQDGWYVFHDVPMDGKTSEFNLDHVVVGPRGLFVIETKSWRKKKTKKGEPIPCIRFDGVTLTGPRGIDNTPIRQVERNAKDLTKILENETGLELFVKPILTFPEWAVDFSATGPDATTHVVKSDGLVGFISKGRNPLSDPQVDLVARSLGRRCRTVKY